MDALSIRSFSPPDSLKSTSLSPRFEQFSYLDSEPLFPDVYAMPNPSSRQSPSMDQSSTDPKSKDYFQYDDSTTPMLLSSTSSEETWDEYITWNAFGSPMDFHPIWTPTNTAQAHTNAPLFSGFDDPWGILNDSTTTASAPAAAAAPTSFPYGQSSAVPASSDSVSEQEVQTITDTPTAPSTRLTSPTPSTSTSTSAKSPIKRRSNPTIKTEGKPEFKRPKSRKTNPDAHNEVEKRYRTNLNVKIAELSASVPSLRATMQQVSAVAALDNTSGNEEDDMPRPGYPPRTLKKATVLNRATEYIKHLEAENRRLETENVDLRKRLRLCGRIADNDHTK